MYDIIGVKYKSNGAKWIYFYELERLVGWFGSNYIPDYDELPQRFVVDKVYGKMLISERYYQATVFNLHGFVRPEYVVIKIKEVL